MTLPSSSSSLSSPRERLHDLVGRSSESVRVVPRPVAGKEVPRSVARKEVPQLVREKDLDSRGLHEYISRFIEAQNPNKS